MIQSERDRIDKIIKKAGKDMGEWWSPSVVDSLVYQCRLQSKLDTVWTDYSHPLYSTLSNSLIHRDDR